MVLLASAHRYFCNCISFILEITKKCPVLLAYCLAKQGQVITDSFWKYETTCKLLEMNQMQIFLTLSLLKSIHLHRSSRNTGISGCFCHLGKKTLGLQVHYSNDQEFEFPLQMIPALARSNQK